MNLKSSSSSDDYCLHSTSNDLFALALNPKLENFHSLKTFVKNAKSLYTQISFYFIYSFAKCIFCKFYPSFLLLLTTTSCLKHCLKRPLTLIFLLSLLISSLTHFLLPRLTTFFYFFFFFILITFIN